MEIEKIESSRLGDFYYKVKHPSGLTILLYPKEDASTVYAIFGTRYGSVDNCFRRGDEEKAETVPEGIAHFLEHKLFESEDGDAFMRFAQTGASANAYTSSERTCYLFSCTDRLYDSLEILLDFVQSPYFTEQTVQKELGIISQEIKMYDDDPPYRAEMNYMQAMYQKHPIRIDTAGTVESIAKITPEYLYRCYNTFYNLNNMALVLCGAFDVDKVLEMCDRMLVPSKSVKIERVFPKEPETVGAALVEDKLPVTMPLFEFGYKEPAGKGFMSEKDVAAVEVLLEILASDASPLFQDLLARGLVNKSSFDYYYYEGAGFATATFSGESKDPKAVADAIQTEADRLFREGIPPEDFERAKRSMYGENVAALNSTANIANGLINFAFKGREFFTYIDALAELKPQDCFEKLKILKKDRSVLSIVRPL